METVTPIIVNEDDIDDLDHVNNSVYVTYLQKGREQWYSAVGLSFQEMSRRHIGTAVLRLEVLYKKEVKLGDAIRVRTVPFKLGNTSFTFKQEILNNTSEVMTEATVVSVMINTKKRHSTRVAEEIAKNFSVS